MKNLFLQILDMSVSASILAAAVMLLRLLLKKAPKAIHCVLWAMVALRLLCPSLPESKVSLMPESHPVTSVVQVQPQPQAPAPDVQSPVQTPQVSVPENTVTVTPEPERIVDWMSILGVIWLSGVGAMALYGFGSYIFLRRKVSPAIKEDGIWLCDHVASPFILGIVRPRIYLPSGLEMEHRTSVLAHEKAHLRRKDHWWKPLGFALLAVHWFNPVMWVAYILLCRDIEAACDERVVKTMEPGERRRYSEALLSCAAPRRGIAACPLAFGEQGVKGRIKSVLSYKKPTVWIILAAVVVSIAVGVFFLTNPMNEKEPLIPPTGNQKITALDLDTLRDLVPEYFAYEKEDVEVYVWEENSQIWCGLTGSSDVPITQNELNSMKAVKLDAMYSILRSGSGNSRKKNLNVLGEFESLKQLAGENMSADVADAWIRIELGLSHCSLYGANNLVLQNNTYRPTGDTVSEDQLGLCLADTITITTCIMDPYEEIDTYNVYTIKGKDLSYLVVAQRTKDMVYRIYKRSVSEKNETATEPVWELNTNGTVAASMPDHPSIGEDYFYLRVGGGDLYRVYWPNTEQLHEGQSIRVIHRSSEDKKLEYSAGDNPAWRPEKEVVAINVVPMFTVYYMTQINPEHSLSPNPHEEYYSEVLVTAEDREFLLNIEQKRVWHDVRLSSYIPPRSRVFNVVVDGKWNIFTLYGDGMILKDGYYTILTQEEKDRIKVIINWGNQSSEAENYFTDDYLVYQQKTGQW